MRRILVINNDIDTMSLLKTWLEKKEYHVEYTSNENEARELLKRFNPQIILVDELQQQVIKHLQRDHRIPIILLTGYSSVPTHEFSADDVIEKPFHPELLARMIERYID